MKLIKTILIVLVCLKSYGQNSSPLEQIIPPSPIAKEFDKYLKYDVSLFNGIPEINIPLYEIKVKGLTIPITLSYHASGIKYKQNSGEVGLGWVLNPHYRISKTINGRDDDGSSMPSPILDPGTSMGVEKERSAYLVNFINYETTAGFPTATQSYDGEYDIFTYTLQNGGGSFIETNRQTREYEFLDSRKNKLSRVPSGNGFYYNLIDGNGIKYKMGNGNGVPMETHGGGGFNEISGVGWMATEITTPSNEIVLFDYVTRNVLNDLDHLVNATSQDGINVHANRCFPTTKNDNTTPYSLYVSSFLKTITTGQEKIEFFRDELDYLLKKIEIRDINNILKRKIEFTYSQNIGYTFLDKVSIFPADNSSPQNYLFGYYPQNGLASDMTFDNWGYHYYINVFPTNHDYILPEVQNDQFENRTTQDCINSSSVVYASQLLSNFAFNKKLVNSPPIDFSLKRITYPTGGYTEYEYESHLYLNSATQVGGGLRVKKISSNDAVKGNTLIKEYKYGPGENGKGFAKINLANWDFVKEGIWSVKQALNGPPTEPGGIDYRFIDKQFVYSTLPGNEAVTDANGVVYYPEVNEYIKDSGGNILGKTQHLFTVPNYWFGAYDQFQTNSSHQEHLGWLAEITSRTYYPRYIKNYAPWVKPYLTETNIYSYSNNSFNLLKKDKITYNEIVRNTYSGLKVRPFLLWADAGYSARDVAGNSPYDGLIHSLFDYAKYSVISGTILPAQKITTDFTSPGTLVVTQNYYYNENDQVIKEEITDSKSGNVIKENKYSVDYKNLTATDALTLGIKNLQNLNILEPVIENSIWRKNSTGATSLVAAHFTSFKSASPFPDQVLRIETSTALTDFSSSSVQGGAIVKDNRYKTQASFNQYDNKGNILEQQKANSVKQSYVWGYDGNYPIAEVINTPVKDVFHTSFEDVNGNSSDGDSKTGKKSKTGGYQKSLSNLTNGTYLLSYWQKSGTVWSLQSSAVTVSGNAYSISITGQVDEVRFYPSTAQMTTYTYEPLIGLTSICDANNRIAYYEYDGFGRLAVVRDADRNVVKTICYSYAGNTLPCSFPVTYYSEDKSGNYSRNNCPTGQTPGTVYVSVPARMFTSAISVADANNKALAYAQQQANQNASCTQNIYIQAGNWTANSFSIRLVNAQTFAEYNFTISSNFENFLGEVPAGNYSIEIYETNYTGNYYNFSAGCGYYGNGNSYIFYNIPINSGCYYIQIN